MSKRKAPQGDNPNKDICDMLMGKDYAVMLVSQHVHHHVYK